MCQISTLIAGAFQIFLGASCERRSLRVFSVVIPKQFLNNLAAIDKLMENPLNDIE